MHIKIEGLDKLEQKLNNLVNPEKMRNNVEQACLIVEAAAKEKTPVLTGELRRSIQTNVNFYGDITEGHVFSNLEYAPYVEYGTGLFAENGDGRKDVPWRYQAEDGQWYTTSGQSPQPYLRPALIENKEKVKQKILEGIVNG